LSFVDWSEKNYEKVEKNTVSCNLLEAELNLETKDLRAYNRRQVLKLKNIFRSQTFHCDFHPVILMEDTMLLASCSSVTVLKKLHKRPTQQKLQV